MRPFIPMPAATANISVSDASQSVSLAVSGGPRQVRIFNNGSATVWINFGLTGVTAAVATGMPVGAGVTEVVSIPDFGGTAYASAIAAGSTGSIYFTPGDGI